MRTIMSQNRFGSDDSHGRSVDVFPMPQNLPNQLLSPGRPSSNALLTPDRRSVKSDTLLMDKRAFIQVIGGISHDLSNLLMALRVHLSLAHPPQSAKPDADSRAHTEGLHLATQRLQRLIDALHALGDEGTGSLDLSTWWAQTSSLLAKVLPRGVELVVDIDPALPRVRGDRGELTRRAFDELHRLGEQLAATGPGSVQSTASNLGRIRVVAKPAPDASTIELLILSEASPAASLAVLPVSPPTPVESEPCRAVVTLASERSAAIVRFMLITTLAPGSSVVAGIAPDGADMWVVEPGPGRLTAAQKWRSATPAGRLVLVGDPGDDERAAWTRIGSLSLTRADQLDVIRELVSRNPPARSPEPARGLGSPAGWVAAIGGGSAGREGEIGGRVGEDGAGGVNT